MKPVVYIETTIPSFYYDERMDAKIVARRQWTREWWDDRRQDYTLVTSAGVLSELERGGTPKTDNAIRLLNDTEVLQPDPYIDHAVSTYIERFAMPNDPEGDALHLAYASFYRCHFLLTWNCAHLANPNKTEHIHHVNNLLGLPTPVLLTPEELLGTILPP